MRAAGVPFGGDGREPLSCSIEQGIEASQQRPATRMYGVVVAVGAAAVVEVRRGNTCADPHRPSDSVFVNGSGYLIKDTVRARLGCP